MAPSLKFKNMIALAVWLAMFGLIPTSCVRTDKDEAARQPVSDDVAAISVDEPPVQTAQETFTAEASSEVTADAIEANSSKASVPAGEPLVQTAQESPTTGTPSEVQADTSTADSTEASISVGQPLGQTAQESPTIVASSEVTADTSKADSAEASISVGQPLGQTAQESPTIVASSEVTADTSKADSAEASMSVDQPLVQAAQESPTVTASSEVTVDTSKANSAETSLQLDEPLVQTAQESPTAEAASEVQGDTTEGESAEIVSIPEAKRSANAEDDSAEKAGSAPASTEQPVVETARMSRVQSRVKSARIVSMQPAKHSVDPKDFDINGVAGSEPVGVAPAPKKPSILALLMHRLAMFLIEMDPRARLVPTNERPAFSPDPTYIAPYDSEAQLAIYGAKHPNPTARPLIEAGRELYGPGTFEPGINLLGSKNLVFPQLLMYGDTRTAIAYNDNGAIEKGLIATRLNLDVDLKITGTERIHLFITPLQRGALFTRVEFAGDKQHSGVEIDFEPQALFFEGDIGRLMAGFSDEENHIDLPFTLGLIPLLFQNGVWLQDGFVGGAITITARNSPTLGITNADITFFTGFDQVTTGAIPNDHRANIFGIASFVEAASGYFEFDYGYTEGRKNFADLSYHNFSAAFTRRYFDTVSNSVRVIYNFGQDPDDNHRRTADGVLLLVENSLITPLPLTLVPYLNLFAGFNKPQSLARANAAGGVLLNTGILFETDNLTGFPTMDATGHDTYGGSIGLEYLFDLHQQIVVEVSALGVMGDAKDRTANGSQVGFGIRYQLPLNNAWLFRADMMVASRANDQDLFGIRGEFRRKF